MIINEYKQIPLLWKVVITISSLCMPVLLLGPAGLVKKKKKHAVIEVGYKIPWFSSEMMMLWRTQI